MARNTDACKCSLLLICGMSKNCQFGCITELGMDWELVTSKMNKQLTEVK